LRPAPHSTGWRSWPAKCCRQGIGFEWTELAFQQQQPGTSSLLVFGAAALFVFLVLAAQYESWKLPLAVVMIVPMCLLASVTGLLIRGMAIDVLAQIGFVVLVGLAAKNAILIVEFARQTEQAGANAREAAVTAARTRLRPILDDVAWRSSSVVAPLVVATGAGSECVNRWARRCSRACSRDRIRPVVHARVLYGRQHRSDAKSQKLDPTKPRPRAISLRIATTMRAACACSAAWFETSDPRSCRQR